MGLGVAAAVAVAFALRSGPWRSRLEILGRGTVGVVRLYSTAWVCVLWTVSLVSVERGHDGLAIVNLPGRGEVGD